MAAAKFPIELRGVGIDDIAEIRALHKSSFRAFAHTGYSDYEIEQFQAAVDSAAYADVVLGAASIAAYFDGTMVGSAGWLADGQAGSRRISHVYVRPMFTRRGIGTVLVQACEASGATAGDCRYEVRATHNSVEFFERLGYEVTGYGVGRLAGPETIAVTFMRKGPKLPTAVYRPAAGRHPENVTMQSGQTPAAAAKPPARSGSPASAKRSHKL